ncbi:hypothetical protein P5V15_001255 [Pogonomyrmex californicus]
MFYLVFFKLFMNFHEFHVFLCLDLEISPFKIVNTLVNQIKVEDKKLEQILDENSCQTQLELANELGVTHRVISPTKAEENPQGIPVGPS